MARPIKTGLAYFPHDTDYYDDFKIVDLMYEHGPLGQTVYDVILTFIYKNGYYIELPLDKMVQLVIRTIGNRWARKDAVTQVILYCGDIGLFDKPLLSQNVFTSVAVQRRYREVNSRNKVDMSKYGLLDDGQSWEDTPSERVFVTETEVNVTETEVNVTKIPIKENKIKIKENNNICVDCREIVSLFNSICTGLASVRDLTDGRRKAIKAADPRVKEYGGWDKLFKAIQNSDFLTGRSGTWTNCGFDWILKPANLIKIMEGNYNNKAPEESERPSASYDMGEIKQRTTQSVKYIPKSERNPTK